MSSVYVSEPPTKGKVIVTTTYGPLDIELWPKEAPKAVRNFVQLCLEGYYDNTIFHRIIKGFLVQGGDPTGSGTGTPPPYLYIVFGILLAPSWSICNVYAEANHAICGCAKSLVLANAIRLCLVYDS
ncbi:Peptidyl-prolyl cis-trans isomerase CYP57 [Vitis vinifera]|uniref:Peptidyl-prolyl cis-trans isomerase n=1 Tax=Vitis vinifera TaxID=29760 RepID=A0A438K7X6_VITVI|nr:Peptidyl-prolyl cis-trans isomerase CYP57 [Vitis vinifera]